MQPNEEKNWSLFCHLAAITGFVIPFGNVIGPLVVWLIKKDESEQVNSHGKAALNFQITMTLAMIVAALSIFIIIGFLLLPLVALFDLVMVIVATVKVSNGESFTYPLSLQLIK